MPHDATIAAQKCQNARIVRSPQSNQIAAREVRFNVQPCYVATSADPHKACILGSARANHFTSMQLYDTRIHTKNNTWHNKIKFSKIWTAAD